MTDIEISEYSALQATYPSLLLGLGSVTAGPSSHILAEH